MTTRIRAVLLALAFALTASAARAEDRDPWLGKDKALHFTVSAGLAVGSYAIARPLLEKRPQALTLAGGMAFSFGIAKETWDLTGHGDPSWKDLTWDAIGTVSGLLVALVADFLINRE